jgi:hypothetical protein
MLQMTGGISAGGLGLSIGGASGGMSSSSSGSGNGGAGGISGATGIGGHDDGRYGTGADGGWRRPQREALTVDDSDDSW